MSTATLEGIRCMRARVHIPAWGVPWVEAELDSEATLAGAVSFVLADLTVSGTIVSGGPWLGRSRYWLVAGAGGWHQEVSAKGYANDLGVKRSTILGDAASECGESVETLPSGTVGPSWVRERGLASTVLESLYPQGWYVGTDGVTRIGLRAASSLSVTASRGKVDFAAGTLELMADSIASIMPGIVVDGLAAGDVVHDLHEQKLRTTLYGSATAGPSKRLDAWRRLFERLDPSAKFCGVWEYRVVSQSGDRLNLQAPLVSSGMPHLLRVKVRPGLPGCVGQPALGSMVLVAFVNRDRARPVVVGFDDSESSGFQKLLVGPAPAGTVVRVGDLVTVGTAAGALSITGPYSGVKA